jgi:hypothetical protein
VSEGQPNICSVVAASEGMNQAGGYPGIGSVFNRWWLPNAPLPNSGPFAGYFEVMTAGNVWLPEDLHFILVEFSGNAAGQQFTSMGPPGLWGTELGERLREWLKHHRRPLIWSDAVDGPMLLDPIVDGIATEGGKSRFSAADRALFRSAKFSKPWETGCFDELVAEAAPHLRFYWPSYLNRSACEEEEQDGDVQVMGVDGNGACVYWRAGESSSPELPDSSGLSTGFRDTAPAQYWELLNDGTCERTSSAERATAETKKECLASVQGWSCLENIPDAAFAGTCLNALCFAVFHSEVS